MTKTYVILHRRALVEEMASEDGSVSFGSSSSSLSSGAVSTPTASSSSSVSLASPPDSYGSYPAVKNIYKMSDNS